MAAKRVERSACVSFCPHTGLLAAGTVAGAIDDAFSTNSVLEVFALDFAAKGDTLPVVGKVQASERFYRLAWGSKLPGAASQGLLAGGLADGSVVLWDPAAIVEKKEGVSPLLAKMQKHKGEVKGLEFNTFSPNLLASGAADGELCIWDLAKPAHPTLYPALKGGTAPGTVGGGNEITFISWNRKVQHILASSTTNGTTVVWDLKRQKPVISLRDPNSQRRASVLQWNPEVATQLVVASDDDRSPTLQMWDLRNSVAPLKEFVGHHKGVLGMAWSAHDPTLLLSSGKDGRTVCWDAHTAEVMCELSSHNNWNFDVQWCPTMVGVFATSSYDGHVAINNLLACTGAKTTEVFDPVTFTSSVQTTGESTPLKRAPHWLKRPSGVSFGFGGRLVSFQHTKVSSQDAAGNVHVRDNAVVNMSQVVTEHDLIQRSEAFEQAIAGGDKSTLQGFCMNKAQTAEADEAETWSFLGLLYENDARRELLRKLGFQDVVQAQQPPPEANGSVTSPNGNAALAAATSGVEHLSMEAVGRSASQAGAPEDFFGNQDASDFFDKIEEPVSDAQRVSAGGANASSARASADGDAAASAHAVPSPGPPAEMPAGHADASVEHEEEIQRALIAGNYEAAVESCFKANRMADALLIANIFNSDLYKRTMNRYMKRCPKPFMQIIRANNDQDWETLVRTRPVGQWRETLALLATYTHQEEWAHLCDVLATRLTQAGMQHAASLCYICAGNVDQAVAYWSKSVQALIPKAGAVGKAAEAGVQALQGVIEKAVLFGLATGNKKASGSLSDLVTKYASILAAQGRMRTALEYLDYVPGEASTTVAVLKDRIFRSGQVHDHQGAIPTNVHAPPFPFVREDVKPGSDKGAAQPAAAAAPAAHAQPASTAYGAHASTYNTYGAAAATTASTYSAYTAQPAQPAYASTPAQPAYSAYSTAAPAAPQQSYAQPSYDASAYGSTAATGGMYNASEGMYHAGGYGQPSAATSYSTPAGESGGGAVYTATKRAAPPAASNPPQFVPSTTSYTPPAAAAHTTAAPAYAPQPMQPAAAAPAQPAAPPPKPVTFMPAVTAPSNVPVPPAAPASTPSAFAPAPPGAWGAAPAPPPATAGGMPGGLAGSSSVGGPGMSAAAPAKPAAPPPPAGPPANVTVTTVDTSKVPPEQRAIVNSLTALYNSCAPMANNPAKKREMDDNSRKLGQLLWKLNNGDVSEGVVPKLLHLCQAIDAADWHTANHLQVQMTTTDWEECGFWLATVKRLIKLRQQPA